MEDCEKLLISFSICTNGPIHWLNNIEKYLGGVFFSRKTDFLIFNGFLNPFNECIGFAYLIFHTKMENYGYSI